MTIQISQPNFGSASQSVRISINGVPIGTIGPGETVVGQTAAAESVPWKVVAVCGMYRAEAVGLCDAELQIRWHRQPPSMKIRMIK